jgi:cell division protein FtsB
METVIDSAGQLNGQSDGYTVLIVFLLVIVGALAWVIRIQYNTNEELAKTVKTDAVENTKLLVEVKILMSEIVKELERFNNRT